MTATANSLAKYNSSALFGAIVTFLLFYFMQYLISTEDTGPRQLPIIKIVDPTVPVFEPELFTKIEKPAEIEPLQTPVINDPPKGTVIGGASKQCRPLWKQ